MCAVLTRSARLLWSTLTSVFLPLRGLALVSVGLCCPVVWKERTITQKNELLILYYTLCFPMRFLSAQPNSLISHHSCQNLDVLDCSLPRISQTQLMDTTLQVSGHFFLHFWLAFLAIVLFPMSTTEADLEGTKTGFSTEVLSQFRTSDLGFQFFHENGIW